MAAEFRQLPDLEIADYDEPLPLGPSDLTHGVLPNGIRYYVKTCAKPQKRAALALAVKIGSAVEHDDEQGVAHIVEHLAFNATEKYANHDLIKYLESIGAEFGACQNAYTSADDTVYEFVVPTDDDNLDILDRSFDVFAEFATKIRCSTADLDNERGAVMEEWRSGKDSRGRAAEAQWKLIMHGNKYAERLPIGKEEIIQGIPASKVLAFYKRWYRPENMAVVAIGDFADPQAVVNMIQKHMGKCQAANEQGEQIPRYELTPHSQPRLSAFVDKEQQHANIHITFNHPRGQISTPASYVGFLQDGMFQAAVNNRFYKLCRKPEPAFWAAQVATEQVTKTIEGYTLAATVGEGGITKAMKAAQEDEPSEEGMDEDATPDKADDKADASQESPLDALARAAESVDSQAAAQEASDAAAEGAPEATVEDAAVPADGASVKVDHSEQAAAVDVKMTESDTAGEQPSSDAADTKHKFDAKQTEPSSEPKGAEPLAASADKGKAKEEADKGGDDKKEGKEKVVDEDLLRAFRYFDKTGTGYVKTEDMRRILHNLGLRLSYRQVKDLCTHVAETTGNTGSSRSSRADRIYYRHLTDQIADEE